jgi:hypothetical protein
MQVPESEVGGLADLGESYYNRHLQSLTQCGNSRPANSKIVKKIKERGSREKDVVAAHPGKACEWYRGITSYQMEEGASRDPSSLLKLPRDTC